MYYVLRYGVRYLRKGHSLVLQSESTTQVALERECKRCLVFEVSILIARKQLAAECNQQLVTRSRRFRILARKIEFRVFRLFRMRKKIFS